MNQSEKKQLLVIADKAESLGIEQLKKIKTWEAGLIKEIYRLVERKRNGKRISKLAFLAFVDDAIGLGSIISKHKIAIDEIKDLSPTEIVELNNHFNSELEGIPAKDEKVIEIISQLVTFNIDGVLDIIEEASK